MKIMTACLLAVAALFSATSTAAQAARVGTFDRQAIALAYYRSPQWAEVLSQKRAELKAAQQANDEKKVDELKKWGGESQELAHRQVFGNEPIDNILSAIRPALEDICKSQNLATVIPAPAPETAPGSVDVTAQLLDWLQADKKTRHLIGQMQVMRQK